MFRLLINPLKHRVMLLALAYLAMLLAAAACTSSYDERREPVPLVNFQSKFSVDRAWKVGVGKAKRFLFSPVAVGDALYAAGANGLVVKIDGKTGKEIWRTKLGVDLSAGVGSDGTLVAVGALKGGLYVLGEQGKLLWKANASGEMITSPLVGNGFVIVRTIDGQISAFDAQTGALKWVYRARAIPLNLRVSAGMVFAGEAAVLAGFPGGGLAAINLQTGDEYWQTPVSYPKGVTEVERVNDVTGAPVLLGTQVCAVTFQGQIGCFDANSGRPFWMQPFSGATGLAQDHTVVAASDDWSVLKAFDVTTGKLLWHNDALKNRNLSTPLLLGPSVVVGDYQGYVHFLSRDDGALIARVKTDGTAITSAPIMVEGTLVVQTQGGGLYGFRPR